MPTKKPAFEASMARLDVIVSRLEQGDVSLEEALALFEEGAGLMKECSALLDRAEQRVAKLLPGADGTATELPMEEMDHDL